MDDNNGQISVKLVHERSQEGIKGGSIPSS